MKFKKNILFFFSLSLIFFSCAVQKDFIPQQKYQIKKKIINKIQNYSFSEAQNLLSIYIDKLPPKDLKQLNQFFYQNKYSYFIKINKTDLAVYYLNKYIELSHEMPGLYINSKDINLLIKLCFIMSRDHELNGSLSSAIQYLKVIEKYAEYNSEILKKIIILNYKIHNYYEAYYYYDKYKTIFGHKPGSDDIFKKIESFNELNLLYNVISSNHYNLYTSSKITTDTIFLVSDYMNTIINKINADYGWLPKKPFNVILFKNNSDYINPNTYFILPGSYDSTIRLPISNDISDIKNIIYQEYTKAILFEKCGNKNIEPWFATGFSSYLKPSPAKKSKNANNIFDISTLNEKLIQTSTNPNSTSNGYIQYSEKLISFLIENFGKSIIPDIIDSYTAKENLALSIYEKTFITEQDLLKSK